MELVSVIPVLDKQIGVWWCRCCRLIKVVSPAEMDLSVEVAEVLAKQAKKLMERDL